MSKERIFIFLTFSAIGFIAYRNCFNILIPSDNYSQLYSFAKGIILNIKDKNNSSPYLFSFPALFVLYKILGVSSTYWITTSLIIHIVNTFLVYLVTEIIFKRSNSKNNIPFFSALFVLISPYQTEAVIWSPSEIPTTLLVTGLTLLSLLSLLNYYESQKKILLLFSHLTFLLAVFSHESAFVLPVILTLLFLLHKKIFDTKFTKRHFIAHILLPQAGIIFLYLITSNLLFGEWLWHGGSGDITVSFYKITGTFVKYMLKFFLFYRYLPVGSADGLLRNIFYHQMYVIIIFLLLFMAVLICFRFIIKKDKVNGEILFILFLCFIISLVPVLPLDSSFLKYIYPDRYGYLPSVFFYIFLVTTTIFIFKKIAVPILLGYTILCWILLAQTIPVWNSANNYCNQLIRNYKPFLKYDNVYVLNMPSYYKGIAAFRCAFPEAIYFMYEESPIEKIHVISGCYQESIHDSLASIKMNGTKIKVNGPRKTTPHFSTNGGWAQSYETNEYALNFDTTKCSYTLSFKNEIPPNSAIIYTTNGSWKKVN